MALQWIPDFGVDINRENPVGGDQAFYDSFLAPLQNKMLRTLWRILRDHDLARDALQNALIVILKRRDTVASHPNPEALVLKICIDAAYDCLRKEKRYPSHASVESVPAMPSSAGTSSHTRTELAIEIGRALGELSRNQAVAVILRVIQEQDYETIAQALGCRATTARIHFMRGRAKLSRRLAHLAPTLQSKEGIHER